eukprot:CAMPEP_0117439540 /NCGR_PEP_ID=MMETSP0759-20121206/2617_1 /TAXON_ID=63605 /ORGANISM="Percolomonas cosmopolitus, Strain WS" /LENGTH=1122 /DNA_ID=CAMNT_0005231257 /DNA_START=59 /DNA_END=3424 /DNA_ORIENTATION=-
MRNLIKNSRSILVTSSQGGGSRSTSRHHNAATAVVGSNSTTTLLPLSACLMCHPQSHSHRHHSIALNSEIFANMARKGKHGDHYMEKLQKRMEGVIDKVKFARGKLEETSEHQEGSLSHAHHKPAPQINNTGSSSKDRGDLSSYMDSLEQRLVNGMTGVKQKNASEEQSPKNAQSQSDSYHFSSMQYESTLESLKQQALRGNVNNMLLIYNFLYNHGECQDDVEKHAALLRIVFMGFVHAKDYNSAEHMLAYCFQWEERSNHQVQVSRSHEEQLELKQELQQVNDAFQKLILPSQTRSSFPMRSFFHCEHERIPMHTHILNLYFDVLAGQRNTKKLNDVLEWVKAHGLQFLEPNMSSIYSSFMLAELNKENYSGAQQIFYKHFISPLNKNADTLLETTNAKARARAGRKLSALDMEAESDFRIEPNNLDVAEPNIYAYSMLITSYLMQGDLETSTRITDYLYASKYYNVVTATQALLINSRLFSKDKIPLAQVQKTWEKYFDPKRQLVRMDTGQSNVAQKLTESTTTQEDVSQEEGVTREDFEKIFSEGTAPESYAGKAESANYKCIPDSRAVAVYLMALLHGNQHAMCAQLLGNYTETYVPDSISIQLVILKLIFHASISKHLKYLDEAQFLYNRFLNTENSKLRHPMKLPLPFYKHLLKDLEFLLNTNAKNNVVSFMEMCLKDCLHHYSLKEIGAWLIKKAESLQLGHVVRKKMDEEKSNSLFAYVPPQEVIDGLPKDLQIYPGVREREYAFSVSEFVSLISLGTLDESSLKEQERQFVSIIKMHHKDPSVGKLMFHHNPEHPPRNSTSYSIVCGVNNFGNSVNYVISIPWTIKLVDLGILKLKSSQSISSLKKALETWADHELAWFSLEDKRATYPVALTNSTITSQQMQILSKHVREQVSMKEQIADAERELATHNISFETRTQLVEAMSVLRCALQQEIDNGIRAVLQDMSLTIQEQDDTILRSLRRFCPDLERLTYSTHILRGILHADEVDDILLKCACMPAPIIEQNRRARQLLNEKLIALPQPIAVRMKEEREKANVLNPKVCPQEVRASIYDQCVMLPASKAEQNSEAMSILCDFGYTLNRQSVERGMRDARQRLREKKRPHMVGGFGRVAGA